MTPSRWAFAFGALAAVAGGGACSSLLGDFEGSGTAGGTSATSGAGGAGGAGGTGTHSTTGTHATTGTGGMGAGGKGGASADGGILEPPATSLVSGGRRATSPSFVMVSTLGQSTQNQEAATSPKFLMQGGLIGAIGSKP